MGVATEDSDRIVLVDRSGDLERRLEPKLAAEGYTVTVVGGAAACLRTVEEKPVASVVSEYGLADVDGVTLLRSVRISQPSLPFVLVPSEGSESIAGEAIAAGVSGYVPQAEGTDTVLARILEDLQAEGPPSDGEEGHRRYRQLIEMAPAPINIFDEAGEVVWGNDAVVELLGLEGRHELLGRSIFEFIHPDDRDLARRELETVIEEKSSVGPTRMKLLRPDGQLRHIRVATAVGSYLGADIGQAIVVDVTEREELHRQLKVLSTWLRHNIRNEMNIVHGIAGQLRREGTAVGEGATMIQAHVEHLVEQADRERELVDLLVDPPPQVTIDVASAIDEQARAKRSEYPVADIEVALDADDGIEVEAVPQLGRAIGELIDNAVRHNDAETPTVRIEADRSDRTGIEIRVRDDGPGIPAVEREIVRLEQSIDQLNHGFGLGLLFVYCVVTQSGGAIRFSDADPRGSVVTVTLPVEGD